MYHHNEGIKNLGHILQRKAKKNPEKIAFVNDTKFLRYEELSDFSSRTASGLDELGVVKGDKVAVLLENSFEFIYSWFGVARLGAILVPLNISLKGDLLKYQINDSDAKVVITAKPMVDEYARASKNLENVVAHVCTGIAVPEGFIPFDKLLQSEAYMNEVDILPSDPASIIYTSGTTGPPKGVVLPHFAYINSAVENSITAEVREGDVFYSTVPFSHTSGQLQVILPALLNDLTAAFDQGFHASTFWRSARNYNATVIFLISSMINILLKGPTSHEERRHKVRVAMTGGARKELWEEFEKRFGTRVLEGYGMTETCAIAIFNRGNEVRVGSVGRPLPHFEAKVVDEEDNDLPSNTKGELVIRPKKPFTMMLEYYKKSKETVESWRNLWFHTGDIFYTDDEGFLYFVERKKDVIRRRGENIAPYDVECIVNQHPSVLESVSVGVPSELGEEDVKVYIKLKFDMRIDFVEFLKYCEDRLPHYMVPRYIEVIDSIPKTSTERPQRYLLKARGVGNAFDADAAGYMVKRRPSS